MAKVHGPLFSMEASGTIAEGITYSRWRGISYVRQWFKPENPRSEAQVAQRERLTRAVNAWHQETDDVKQQWNEAAPAPLSGFNYYVKKYIQYNLENGVDPTLPFTP
ncbi:MAG: hypothetical protein DRP09_15370 [Candidatus Thorarchaeota archaeon]|nr:MAG: hypothetical protein DRP09_15370 [Candidatus Thorarchaeota archaeon]